MVLESLKTHTFFFFGRGGGWVFRFTVLVVGEELLQGSFLDNFQISNVATLWS